MGEKGERGRPQDWLSQTGGGRTSGSEVRDHRLFSGFSRADGHPALQLGPLGGVMREGLLSED